MPYVCRHQAAGHMAGSEGTFLAVYKNLLDLCLTSKQVLTQNIQVAI